MPVKNGECAITSVRFKFAKLACRVTAIAPADISLGRGRAATCLAFTDSIVMEAVGDSGWGVMPYPASSGFGA